MKIIISIRPEWACKILNRDKTIEVRKGLALYNALKRAEEKGEEVEFLMYVTKAKPYLDYIEDDCLSKNYQLDYDKLKKLPKPKKGMTEDDPLFDDYTYNDMVLRLREARKDGSLYSENYYNLNGQVVARFKATWFEEIGCYTMGKTYRYYHSDYTDELKLLEKSCLSEEQIDAYLQGKEGTALRIEDLEIFDKPKDLADYGLKRAPQSWGYAKKGGTNGES